MSAMRLLAVDCESAQGLIFCGLQDQILCMDGDRADVLKNLKQIFNLLSQTISLMPEHNKVNAHTKVKNQLDNLKRKFGKVSKRPAPRAGLPASTASTAFQPPSHLRSPFLGRSLCRYRPIIVVAETTKRARRYPKCACKLQTTRRSNSNHFPSFWPPPSCPPCCCSSSTHGVIACP